MKQYDTYKDSGVKWIGTIPNHWKVLAVKHFCNAIYAGGTPSTNVEEYWNGDIDWLPSGVCHDNRVNFAPQKITQLGVDNSSTKFIPADTALLAMTGATCGHTAFCEIDAYANQSVTAYINHKNKLNSLFLWYLLQSAHEYITTFQSGGAQGGINVEQCKNWILCFPPLEEQKAIAEWLDVKCGEIDKVIASQQRRIELLQELRQSIITRAVTHGINPDAPLKPSGIDWIGDVPNHWEIGRMKFTGKFDNGLTYSPNDVVEDENGYLVLRSTNIQDNKLDYNDCVYVNNTPDELLVKNGDIIICSRNGSANLVGKCAIVDKDVEHTTFGAFMMRYRPYINSKYAFYMFQSATSYYKGLFSTTTINQLTKGIVSVMKAVAPPLAEQQEIVDYIECETGKVDTAIARANREISLLQELRQSVITEVVTGKRKVC